MKRVLLLCVLCACAVEVDESTTEQDAMTAFANDKAAFDFFVGKGLTNFQAAGIVGNLDQESGVDPTIAQYGGGPGRGIAQWSVGGRWDTGTDSVAHYANQQGQSIYSLNLQLEFIWWELTQVGYGYSQLRATTNVTDATLVFMSDYEICGTCASAQRIAYANDVLDAYGQIDYGASYVSQSWPLATDALVIHCGETIAAEITLKNTGTKPWDTSTRLGTTEPRDRASMFAGADWIAPNRPAGIEGTVAPGETGTFSFSFQAPSGDACVPGTYHEHFGLVEENVAWFSDNAMGGPPDDQIEAQLQVVPADPNADPMDPTDPTDPTMQGDSTAAGCNAGGGGAGVLLLIAVLPLRRRRR
jgi:hypothetical protein